MGLFSIFKKKDKKKDVETEKTVAVENTPAPEEASKAEKPAEKKAEAPKAEKPAEKKEAAPKAEKTAEKKAPAKKAAAPKAEEKKEEKAEPEKADGAQPITGRFEIKKSKDDRYVFNLYAANKVIVATSQIYSSARAAVQGIQSVINNSATAPVEDQTIAGFEPKTNPKWEIYKDKGNQFRFRLNAANGQTICHSQGYTTKASCKNGIDSIIRSSRNAEIDKAYLDA